MNNKIIFDQGKKKENMPFITTGMSLEHIKLSELSQLLYDVTYMQNLKKKNS